MRGVVPWFRLSFQLQRWEVLASGLGVTLLAIAMAWLAWQLRGLAEASPQCADPSQIVAGCERVAEQLQGLGDWANRSTYLSYGAPFGMGLLLGAPLVAREVEGRTAQVAWTLSRSRLVWLARRVAFAALIAVVLLAIVAIAGEILAAASLPGGKPGEDFFWYGRRGGLIVARGLAALGIGVLVGAMTGRTLPALLAAAFASVLIFVAVSLTMDRWNESEGVLQAVEDERRESGLQLGARIELTSGEMVTWPELQARGIDAAAIDMDGNIYANVDDLGDPSHAIGVDRILVVPGRLYPQIVLRESGVLALLTVVFLALAGVVVSHRRPG